MGEASLAELSRLTEFVDGVSSAQGHPALSEHKMSRLGTGRDRVGFTMSTDGSLIAVVQAARHEGAGGDERWAVEAAVSPAVDAAPVWRVALEALDRRLPRPAVVDLWAWTEVATSALRELGCREVRSLHQVARALPVDEPASVPHGFRLAPFRLGVDDAALVAVNNAAFVEHPENSSMTLDDFRERVTRAWFDAGGIVMAWHGAEFAGFCWTKRHPDGSGEIYIIGVDPTWQGRGVGRALVVAGLEHLASVGATTARLYVDGANHAARWLYRDLGFVDRRVGRVFRDAQPNR